MRGKTIASVISLDITKTDDDVHYVDVDVNFEIKFRRQIAV